MRRLNHPVYRNRIQQIAADALLIALAYFLAFQLRFLDDPNGWPDRYETLFAQSVGFVIAGKLIVFYAFGLYQKWWRYVSGRDFLLILRAVAVA
ncbi:MAG TPA: polysaccharide biosynthesis protein, partial [Solirubrobacterales bacterium]